MTNKWVYEITNKWVDGMANKRIYCHFKEALRQVMDWI
jgi:hypothetical protein